MEGWAAAKFLISKGAQVVGHDFVDKDKIKENFINLRDYLTKVEKEQEWKKFSQIGIKINYQDSYLADIESADIVFLPQSWFRYDFNKPIKKSKENLKCIGILDLYLGYSKAINIGVTGSNGKSTTSQMIYQILKASGKEVLLSGNDRENLPVLNKVEQLSEDSFLILEISNRQLIDFDKSVDIGLITNIFPTHIDDHGSFQRYCQVKANLIRYQDTSQKAVINFDDNNSNYLKEIGGGEKYFFSTSRELVKGVYLMREEVISKFDNKKELLFNTKDLKVPGFHNLANALGAACVGKLVGAANDSISKALVDFKGIKHRLEFVRLTKGVGYYNDSQSTNPGSTRAALKSFNRPIILILGGKNKPNPKDFDILAEEIEQNKNVKKVLLIGEAAEQIKTSFKRFKLADNIYVSLSDLETSLNKATKIADEGDVVLMSPACESFGEFKDYRERGERFKDLVAKL